MGLTSWKNSPDGLIYKYDVSIAKNYLQKKELESLNDLTNLFLDVAETEAKEQKTMTMNSWIEVADDLLKYRKKNILKDSGKISHKQAVEKPIVNMKNLDKNKTMNIFQVWIKC